MSKYRAIFEETYNKVLSQLKESELKKMGVYNAEQELLLSMIALSYYAVKLKDRVAVAREVGAFLNEINLEIPSITNEMFDNRIYFYGEIIKGKFLGADWSIGFNRAEFRKDPILRLISALGEILLNPAFAKNYENEPVMLPGNIHIYKDAKDFAENYGNEPLMLSDAFVSLTFKMFMMNLVFPNFTDFYTKIQHVTLADDEGEEHEDEDMEVVTLVDDEGEEHEDEDMEVVTLVDDEGEEHEFELVEIIEIEEQEYAVLFPLEGDDDDEAVILRIEADENDEDVLVDITDEDEWNKVVAVWEELVVGDDEEEDDDEEVKK